MKYELMSVEERAKHVLDTIAKLTGVINSNLDVVELQAKQGVRLVNMAALSDDLKHLKDRVDKIRGAA